MASTVALTNLRTSLLAHPLVPNTIAPLTAASRVYKQINADDYDGRFDVLAAFGVVVTEDGTARTGSHISTDGNSFNIGTAQSVLVDTDANGVTATLPDATTVAVGYKVYILMRADGTGDLTVDSAGGDVLGAASQVLTDAGDALRVKSDGTDWIAQ